MAQGQAMAPVADSMLADGTMMLDGKPCQNCVHPPPEKGGDNTAISIEQCGNGNVQCCDSVQKASSGNVQGLLGLLGAIGGVVVDPNTNVGVTCKFATPH